MEERKSSDYEIDTLQKEVNQLRIKKNEIEEELEYSNFCLQSLESDIKNLKNDKLQQKSQIDSLIKENKENKSIIENLKREQLPLKAAVDFSNSIFKAAFLDSVDFYEKRASIAKIKDYLVDHLLPLTTTYFSDAYNEPEKKRKELEIIIQKWAISQQKSWLNRKKVIAFIGEFSAGKTSIINRILSQDNQDSPKLPVSSKPTTAIPTYISYGKDFKIKFIDPNDKIRQISKELLEQLDKDIFETINLSAYIQYLVIEYDNKNLKGISILDTPGFSSNDKQDRLRTLDVIHEADALFWIVDANAGGINSTSKETLETISNNLSDLPLYIVINKSDTKSPKERAELLAGIKTTLDNANIPITEYLFFSKNDNIESLMNIIKDINFNHSNHKFEEVVKYIAYIYSMYEANFDKCKAEQTKLSEKIDNTINAPYVTELEEFFCDSQFLFRDFQEEKSFFGPNKFTINQDNFENFKLKIRDILTKSMQLSTDIVTINKMQGKLRKQENKTEKNRNNFRRIYDIQEGLFELLKSYDYTLSNNVYLLYKKAIENHRVNFKI